MGNMVLFAILFCILMYFLYINGYMIINAKRAVSFIGAIRGRGRCGASFRSCSGYMKRIIRFQESRAYHFALEATIEVDGKNRYTLIFRFKSATGDFKMRWQD